jgi:tRNA uridine 5-carboxymethylaminomethyl modification enzyme
VNGFLESIGTSPISQKIKLANILARPQITMKTLRAAIPLVEDFVGKYDNEFVEMAEITMKYEGYIQKEQDMVTKMSRLEDVKLLENFNYHSLHSLSIEARQKLTKIKPATIGQASRISGVSPSDISILLISMGK